MSFAVLLLFAMLAPIVMEEEESASVSPPVAVSPVVQPIQFSHRLHNSLGLECIQCHPTTESEEQAGLPPLTLCMTCHESITRESSDLKKLKEMAKSGKSIPWEPVYQLPFFVFFVHDRHAEAGIPFSSCHGPVEERDVLRLEGDISMIGCMDCHQKQKASLDCHVCHELSQ